MRHRLQTLMGNYIKCGLAGWSMEILFTAMDSLRRRDMTLKGNTSLWMFPIYGSAALLTPLGRLLSGKPLWVRGLSYTGMFFSLEYLSGRLLSRHSLCPWNYKNSRWNVGRIIRLDFAPWWFCAGLLFEGILLRPEKE